MIGGSKPRRWTRPNSRPPEISPRASGAVLSAVLVGTAILVITPRAGGALVTNDILTHANVTADGNPIGRRTVYLGSPTIRYLDKNGTPIPGGLTSKVVLLFIKQEDGVGNFPVGGLTLSPGSTWTTNGWLRERTTSPGLFSGEVATNGLNGSSFWCGGIDLTGDGSVGIYIRNTSTGTWSIEQWWSEGMFYRDYPDPPTDAYTFEVHGVPAFPTSGTGPVQIESIDIYAPFAVDAPSAAFANIGLSGYGEQKVAAFTVGNLTSNVTYAVEGASNLPSWFPLSSFTATGSTHSVTVTNPADAFFYRLSR